MFLRVAAFALTLAIAAPALAQDPMAHVADAPAKAGARAGGHGGHGAMKACRPDREKYCAGVEKGGGRVMACMKEHAAELSPGCKSALQTMRAERQSKK
jgi:hypothetical protein